MIDFDEPPLAPVEREARAIEIGYNKLDPRRSLANLERQLRANVKWLTKLRPSQLKRRGIHPQAGDSTVGEPINGWALHDWGQLKQILEIKRHALFPRIGNMRVFYELK
jgi:hypothetical protein